PDAFARTWPAFLEAAGLDPGEPGFDDRVVTLAVLLILETAERFRHSAPTATPAGPLASPGPSPGAGGRSADRRDVAVDPEQVLRVVPRLHASQAVDVVSVGGRQSLLAVIGQLEVHVVAPGRVLANRLP